MPYICISKPRKTVKQQSHQKHTKAPYSTIRGLDGSSVLYISLMFSHRVCACLLARAAGAGICTRSKSQSPCRNSARCSKLTRVESHAKGLKDAVGNLEHRALLPDHKHLGMLNLQFTKDIQNGVSVETKLTAGTAYNRQPPAGSTSPRYPDAASALKLKCWHRKKSYLQAAQNIAEPFLEHGLQSNCIHESDQPETQSPMPLRVTVRPILAMEEGLPIPAHPKNQK